MDLKDAWVPEVRLITAYFPDSYFPDIAYQTTMESIDEVIADATKNHTAIIMSADANAVLGNSDTSEDYPALGGHGLGQQNSRGQWMASWCSGNPHRLANPMA